MNYFSKSESRVALYLIPLLGASITIDIIFLPTIWMLFGVVMILVLYGVLVFSHTRAVRINHVNAIRTKQIETIIRDIPTAIIAYDSTFQVLIYNPAAQQIFGASEQAVVGRILDASQASDASLRMLIQVVFSSLAPVVVKLSDPGAFPQVVDIAFHDSMVSLHVVTDRILDERGGVVGFIKFVTDLTREKELLKSKTEFIAVAAHQLRTPLTAVNWALEALEGSTLTEDQKQFVDTAYAAVKNSLNTVNSLLDVSKIEEGKFGYEYQTVPLLTFLDDIIKQAYDLGKQYEIAVFFDRPQEDCRVRIDAQKLSMVFYNLLDNAIKYNVEHGQVTVSVVIHKDDNKVLVQIVDTGIGIPPEQLDKLFSKFFRADNAVKTVADGNGLGLYIARNIVRNHGGDITVTSELNRGTTFTVSLPLAPRERGEPFSVMNQ
ncbi:MAG: ATP-binding protein [Candidatus Paceibacterota bacterium]